MSKGLDKYLQDAEQCHTLEVNYFDNSTTRPTNISSRAETTEQNNEYSMHSVLSNNQESMEEKEAEVNIPESLRSETGHTS